MAEIAHPIEIDLPSKLQDREYRQGYFLAESSADLAEQIAALRKRRGLNQTEVAELVGTKQPAISRVEQADYQNWNFGTVQKIVGALDGRMRVIIEAAEDVLPEYEEEATSEEDISPVVIDAAAFPNFAALLNVGSYAINNRGAVYSFSNQPSQGPFQRATPVDLIMQKDAEIARLKQRISDLESRESATASPFANTGSQLRIVTRQALPLTLLTQPLLADT
jgi:transcriptional regulator with XRE-family HTH domain